MKWIGRRVREEMESGTEGRKPNESKESNNDKKII